jgi:hypothetical protein
VRSSQDGTLVSGMKGPLSPNALGVVPWLLHQACVVVLIAESLARTCDQTSGKITHSARAMLGGADAVSQDGRRDEGASVGLTRLTTLRHDKTCGGKTARKCVR